jgi:hypothetical protein
MLSDSLNQDKALYLSPKGDHMVEKEQFRLPTPISPGDHAAEPDDAVVTVVKYGDYESPDC